MDIRSDSRPVQRPKRQKRFGRRPAREYGSSNNNAPGRELRIPLFKNCSFPVCSSYLCLSVGLTSFVYAYVCFACISLHIPRMCGVLSDGVLLFLNLCVRTRSCLITHSFARQGALCRRKAEMLSQSSLSPPPLLSSANRQSLLPVYYSRSTSFCSHQPFLLTKHFKTNSIISFEF